MNVFKVAWLAGLTDGEGTITARCNKSGTYFIPTWSLGMTHLETMREVQRIVHMITGRKYRLYPQRGKHGHKFCFKIMVGRKAAVAKLLETLLPFLVGKHQQAEIVLRLAQHGARYRGRGPAVPFEPWVGPAIEQVRALNRRGISNEAPQGERVETLPSAHQGEEKVQVA